jgi:hypothetical protein
MNAESALALALSEIKEFSESKALAVAEDSKVEAMTDAEATAYAKACGWDIVAEGQEQYDAIVVQGREAYTVAEFRRKVFECVIGWGAECARSMGVAERARKAIAEGK